MKTLRLLVAFVTSLLAGLALPQAGSAQFFDRPQFSVGILPIGEILYAVEERGFEPISRPRLRGDVYVVEVIDRRGRRARLSVDAYDGVILGSIRPRIVEPAPVYREPRRLFRDGYEERFVPDRGVGDPSARVPSVRIESVPLRPDRARAASELPESGPLPPPRPPEVAMAPTLGPALPPASERAAPSRLQRPEPAALPPADAPEFEAAEPARDAPVAQSPASEAVSSPPEPARQAQRQAPPQLDSRPDPAPRSRAKSLLDDFSPSELDQMDMYPPGSFSR